MADINWGILQPQQSIDPIHIAAPTAQVTPAPNPTAGNEAINQAQQIQIEKAKLGLLQQANQREQGLYPGQLQTQQIQNQGLLNTNQQENLKLQSMQQEWTHHQADLQALQKGGVDNYFKSLETHDPVAATTGRGAIENAKETIRQHGVGAVNDTANLFHTIVPQDYNPQDPKDQVQLMQNYNNNKKLLTRLDPKLTDVLGNNPTPSQVANYAMGTVSTVYGYKQQQNLQGQIRVAAAKEELKPTALSKAQQDVRNAEDDYNSLSDKQSPEAIKALQVLNEAKQGVQAELQGHNPLLQQTAGLINTLGAPVRAVAQGLSNLYSPAAPNQPQTPQPTGTPPTQGGQQLPVQGQPAKPGNQLQPGTIGVNSKGIKAKYLGGDPANPASYQVIP